MSEMVMRVAKAIADEYAKPNGWEDVARAAIAAMREPTKEMREAGQIADNYPFSSAPLSCDVKEVWQIMIDAALKE